MALVAAVVVFGAGCGEKARTSERSGRGAASEVGWATMASSPQRALAPECEGDVEHCVVIATYQGVKVYRNIGPGGFCSTDGRCEYPRNRFGLRWQCVELFNRFFALRYGTEAVPGDARDLLVNALHADGLVVFANGGSRPPVPGDAVVFDDGRLGHVAIVVAVTDGGVDVVEQNVPGDGTNRYAYDRSTNRILSGPSPSAVAAGWIHAQVNGSR